MKKKAFIFIFLLFSIFFIGINNVEASSCVYEINNYEVKYDVTKNNTDVSLDFSTSKMAASNTVYNFTDNLEKSDFISGTELTCPESIYVVYGMNGSSVIARLYGDKKDNSVKVLLSSKSTLASKSNDSSVSEETSGTYKSGCNLISTDLSDFLQTILDYIRIAAIVLAVVLSILDYIKVIFGSDEKSNLKANKNFTTRLIILALLFLIPSILAFLLKLFNIQVDGENGSCGIY